MSTMNLILIELIGGLGLFIAGMNMMSHGIEKVAGNKLRAILEAFTKTKFLGLIVGLFFTAVIQSSSAATVMVVSFVNSGLMMLSEACGIILGANIGTTVTAMLVAFKLSTVAPIFVFIGAIMVNFMKKPMIKKSGEIVLGFGVLFMGISAMSSAMGSIRDIQSVIDVLANFTNPVLGVLLGLVITSVVQSSSVTVSILVVMASQGLVDLKICMFVILGCNIGACTSAVLTSLQGNKNAKRAALIHLLFNVFGTIFMFVVLIFCSEYVMEIVKFFSHLGKAGDGTDSGTLGRNIAWAHFLFKVFQVIVFYPFMDLIIKLTYIIVPGDDEIMDDEEFHLNYISDHVLPDPAVAVPVAVQEMSRMAHMAFDNLNLAVQCLIDNNQEIIPEIEDREKYIDYLDEHISNYLVKINQNALPIRDADMISAYFHVVSDIERIGDHAQSIIEIVPQFYENDRKFSDECLTEISDMMDLINRMLNESLNMFVTGDTSHMQEIIEMEDKIDQTEINLHNQHIRRLGEGKCSAQAGVFFSDVVTGLERVGDHAMNIAFSLIEAKSGRYSQKQVR